MDVAIDHGVADNLIGQCESHADDVLHTWNNTKMEFEQLKASGAMLGAASNSCQVAVDRTDALIRELHRQDKQLFEEVRAAHGDDLRTEEESATMFTI